MDTIEPASYHADLGSSRFGKLRFCCRIDPIVFWLHCFATYRYKWSNVICWLVQE